MLTLGPKGIVKLPDNASAFFLGVNQENVSTTWHDLKLNAVASEAPQNISINVVNQTWHCIDVPYRKQWNVTSQDKSWHSCLLDKIIIDAFISFPIGTDTKNIQGE